MKPLACVLAVLTLLLSGCGSGSAPDADLCFVSAEDHNFLDPQRMTWDHDLRIAGCLYERLVRYQLPDLTIIPGAAERWEISDDKLTYTFHLRPEARWSNGAPVTAEDFIFAWRRALLPDFAFDYTQLFYRIAGGKEFYDWREQLLATPQKSRGAWAQTLEKFKQTVGLSAPMAHTLVVRLAQPTPYFLELCAFPAFSPNPAATLEPMLEIDPDDGKVSLTSRYWGDPRRLVTNGPYVMTRRRFRWDLLMTQNPHYWDKASMANKSILEKIIPQPATALLAYEQGQADWLPDIPTTSSLAADLLAEHRPDVQTVPWCGTYFYNFNCLPTLPDGKKNPLADPPCARALSMGIDRQMIVHDVTRLNQPVAETFIPPGALPGYTPPVEAGSHHDIEVARRLLQQAGYPDGQGLNGLSILYNSGSGHEAIAQAIARAWQRDLGVVVTLQGLEVKVFGEHLRKHDYTIARAAWLGDYRDATTFLDKFQSTNGNNDAAWASTQFDQLLERASHEIDTTARLATLRDAEALMLSDQPIAPIYHYVTLHVFDPKKVQNMGLNMWNFRRLELVKVQR